MKTVKCPRCGSPAEFSQDNKFRPFCSERCKLIDLGDWAEGRYAIPVSTPPEPEELEAALEEAINEVNSSAAPGADDDHLH
jgi:endogenous inhibitor of DNA gyrase (YacG/DUF329 family)